MPKKPSRKLTQKELALQREWEAILAKHAKPLERGAKAKGIKVTSRVSLTSTPVEEKRRLSDGKFHQMQGSTAPVKPRQYTGDKVLGLSTMHKSNLVPVFSAEEAVDIAKMRRG